MTEGKDDFVTSVSDGGVDCVGYDDFVLDDVCTSGDGSAGAFFAPDEQSPVVVPVARGFGATELLVTPPGKYTVFELPPAVFSRFELFGDLLSRGHNPNEGKDRNPKDARGS